MNWTLQRPASPGLYWYRHQQDTLPLDYETIKILWDKRQQTWSAQALGSGTVALDSFNGEWYGPIIPPSSETESVACAHHGRNARIAVRLQHGGSFYVENTIPDDVAITLSEKLKTLHKKGSSIPTNLRAKITGLLHELIKFAEAPSDRERTITVEH